MLGLAISLVLILLVAVLAVLLFLSSNVPTPRQYGFLKSVPGPPGLFLLGNTIELAMLDGDDLLLWMVKQLDRYPRMVRFWLLGQCFVMLREPEDVQVLLTSTTLISKGFEYYPLVPWLNQGLLMSSGEKWHSRRKMLTTPFHFKILEDSLGVFNKHCKVLCSKLLEANGKPVHVDEYISPCTLDVICESAMGIDLGAQTEAAKDYVARIKGISKICVERIRQAWLYRDVVFKMCNKGQTFYKLLNGLHEFTNKVIKQRKDLYFSSSNEEDPQKGKIRLAFLDTLLEIEKRNPGTLSVSDMREEVDTFMFEGQDTTSAALNFFFFLVGSHPEVQDRIYNELEDIFETDMEREITLKDIQKMNYLECSLKESLRMYPSVPYFSRCLKKDLELDGMTLPAGCSVAVLPYHMHRNERFWPEPEKYNPDRFLSSATKDRNSFCYLPFSAGPRNCIGQKFAMMELKMVAATVLRQFQILSITKKEDIKLAQQLVLRSTTPIICKFIPRQKVL